MSSASSVNVRERGDISNGALDGLTTHAILRPDKGNVKECGSNLYTDPRRTGYSQAFMTSPTLTIENSHYFLEQLIEATSEGYWLIDNDAVSIDVNPAMCTILGRARDEILGRDIYAFVDEENAAIFRRQIQRRQQGEVGPYEIALSRPDGTLIPCLNNATPIFDGHSKKVGSIGLWTDLSDLKQSQQLYRDLIDGSVQGILVHRNFKPLFANHRYAELFGFDSPEEILELNSIEPLIQAHEVVRTRQMNADRLEGREVPTSYEYEGRKRDGESIWLNNIGRRIIWQGEAAVQSTVVDVTARVASTRSLRDLYAAIEAMREPVAVFDHDDRFIFFNDAFKEQSRRADSQPTLGEKFEIYIRKLAHAGALPEIRGREEQWLAERMSRHRNPVGPFEITSAYGEHLMINEHRLPSGGCVLLITNVTTLKNQQMDIAAARDQAERASRAKSDFLASMSHELRTPMNSILGFSQLLADDPDDPISERHQRYVDQVLKNGQHLLELINQVLDLARIESGQSNISLEAVNLSAVISECLDLARPLVGQSRIELDFLPATEELPPARADKSVLRQVLLNLISNAIKYNRDDGKVTASVERAAESKVRITVADTGPGIPSEKHAQLFEPFNRLGLEGSKTEGAGIGLTISKQLVEQMEGRIGFESEVGHGSRFWIELPVAYALKRRY